MLSRERLDVSESLRMAILQYYDCKAPLLSLVPGTGTDALVPPEGTGSTLIPCGELASTLPPPFSPLGLLGFEPVPDSSPSSSVPLSRRDSPDSSSRHPSAGTLEPELPPPHDMGVLSSPPPSPTATLQKVPYLSCPPRILRSLPRDHHREKMVVESADRRGYGTDILQVLWHLCHR